MDNANLALWRLVEKTDTRHTKEAKKGQYKFTAIAPMSQFKKATEVFGIQGLKWGVKVGSESFSETAIGETILINYDAIMFFEFEGEKGEIPIHACEKLAYKTNGANGYLKVDEEARKKVVTNAKTKGLSELGFNADVFMGMFDDYEYLQTRKAESEMEAAEDKEQFNREKYSEIKKEALSTIDAFEKIPTVRALDNMYQKALANLRNKLSTYKFNPQAFDESITKAYEKRKQSLTEQQG